MDKITVVSIRWRKMVMGFRWKTTVVGFKPRATVEVEWQ